MLQSPVEVRGHDIDELPRRKLSNIGASEVEVGMLRQMPDICGPAGGEVVYRQNTMSLS